MDAASNTPWMTSGTCVSRRLRPLSGRHKVYILDEAHMLSPQA